MKIYSSKKTALNNINVNVTNYRTILYCTGEYKTTIKTMDVSNDKIVALYKSYRKDRHGSYVKIYCIERIDQNR